MNTKKILLSTLLVSASILTSCKKDYTCECDGSAANLETKTYTLSEKSEADAKATCDSYAENTEGLVVCKLK